MKPMDCPHHLNSTVKLLRLTIAVMLATVDTFFTEHFVYKWLATQKNMISQIE
jgi:hypothetical protein